jgi:hypothetical protein
MIFPKQDKLDGALHKTPCTDEWALRTYDPCSAEKLDELIAVSGGSFSVVRTIYNVSTPVANTEYTQSLGANCLKYILRSRNRGRIELSFSSGANFITVMPSATIEDEGFSSSVLNIFFKSSVANDTIEIISYNKI